MIVSCALYGNERQWKQPAETICLHQEEIPIGAQTSPPQVKASEFITEGLVLPLKLLFIAPPYGRNVRSGQAKRCRNVFAANTVSSRLRAV
jgi:hypothetical protein